ncbi:beta-ketoacyl-[acyl-carrier-protein] synthase family protein [Kibdelosporangium lantanae]
MSHDVIGMGAVTSLGATADETFEALCAGRSGRHPLRFWDRTSFREVHAYEIDDRPSGQDIPGRASALLAAAVGQALADAGLDPWLADVPVLVGSGLGELRSAEIAWAARTPVHESTLDVSRTVRDRFGATDVHTLANACAASLHALALGADLLDLGEADTVVVAGVDVLVQSMSGLLDRVQLDPPGELRPFDVARKGVLLGEGAAAVVLRRGTGTWPARLRGVGLSCDATHVTAPDQAGIARAVRDAHERAGVTAADIDLVVLHGTGTVLNDEVEAAAVAEVFGPHVSTPAMTAVKSMIGHTAGASGLVNLIVAVLSMRSGRVPPVPGLTDPVAEAAGFRFVTGSERAEHTAMAQVNAFGFGGVNAVAVVEWVR